MKAIEVSLKDCFIIEPTVFQDERGYFFESFNHSNFCSLIKQEINFVQDNQSYSKKGVLRGLHFQNGINAQAKLVRVVKGRVLDVVVDLRKKSLTYGHHFSIELSDVNQKQLFVPRGFAHGFVVLSNEAIFSYKCDNYYNKEAEGGIIYNDEDLNIDWILSETDLIISEKDLKLDKFAPQEFVF